MFYAYGDERLRCEQIMSCPSIRYVVNTRLLFEHLSATGLVNIAQRGAWFEPAFPREVFHPRNATVPTSKRTLMLYARPNNLRNLFYLGIGALDEALTRGIIDLAEWQILLLGRDIPRCRAIRSDYAPEKTRKPLLVRQYADLHWNRGGILGFA